MIEPTSPLPAIAALCIALATACVLSKLFGIRPASGRFATIDGLRGLLALAVFLCHACIWYFYTRTGRWELPPSNLYTHFGQSGVALFFMISGFLFFSKLIDGRKRAIDWGALFVSRVLRLTPLYLFTVLLLVVVILYLPGGVREPIGTLSRGVMRWVGFTVMGAPDLNGIENTWRIVAGVTWSLPYEWFFYLSLPLLALSVRVVPPAPYVLLGIATLIALIAWGPQLQHLASFLGGIVAACMVRWTAFRQFAVTTASSVLCLFSLALAVGLFPTAYDPGALALISIAFVLVACGSSLFGLLTSSASRLLGELAYGIYLLHGMLLFVVFVVLADLTQPLARSPMTHWLLIVAMTPLLLLVCYAVFRAIELPAMRRTPAVSAWLRARVGRAAIAAPVETIAPRVDA